MGWKTNKKNKKKPLCVFCILSEGFTKERPQSWFVFGSSLSLSISTISSPFSGAPAASLLRDTGQKNVWSVRVHFTAASGASGCLRSACRRQSAIKNERFGKPRANRFTLMCRVVRKFDCREREKTPDTMMASAHDCFKAPSPLWSYTNRKRWPSYSDKKLLPEFLPCTRGGSARFRGSLPLILKTAVPSGIFCFHFC